MGGTFQSMRRHDLAIVNFPSLKSKLFLHLSIKCNYRLKRVFVSSTFIINVEEPFNIEWAKYDKKAKYDYLSLFQNIALSTNLLQEKAKKEFPKGIPYDYSCPSTKDIL